MPNPRSTTQPAVQLFLRCNLLDFAELRKRSCGERNAARYSAWPALHLSPNKLWDSLYIHLILNNLRKSIRNHFLKGVS